MGSYESRMRMLLRVCVSRLLNEAGPYWLLLAGSCWQAAANAEKEDMKEPSIRVHVDKDKRSTKASGGRQLSQRFGIDLWHFSYLRYCQPSMRHPP